MLNSKIFESKNQSHCSRMNIDKKKFSNLFNKIFYMKKEFPNQQAENDEGNREYKWKLLPRFYSNINLKENKLASQMKYRLYEGNGKALYLIGVTDDGKSIGLPEDEIYSSLKFIRNVAKIIETNIDKIRLYNNKNSFYIATIRLSNENILQIKKY